MIFGKKFKYSRIYKSTKEQATKLLCNYLNPRHDIDCDDKIIEIIDLLFKAVFSRVKCLNIASEPTKAEAWKDKQ
ncbi:hypothetical protein [Myxosarcina sp. GI1(2024)]